MDVIGFSIADLFQNVFGHQSEAFDPKFNKITGGGVDNLNRKEFGSLGSDYYANDKVGREYYMPVKVTYPDETGTASGTVTDAGGGSGSTSAAPVGTLKDWWLPYPVISIRNRKHIIETELTEQNGTLLELINSGNYEIMIRGFAVSKNDDFPEDDVKMLRTIFEVNAAVSISCPLTDIFLLRPDRQGSDMVVVRDLNIPEVKAVQNMRPYEVLLTSAPKFNLYDIS